MADRLFEEIPERESAYAFAVLALIMRSLGIDIPEAASRKRMPLVLGGFDIIVDFFSFTDEASERGESAVAVSERPQGS